MVSTITKSILIQKGIDEVFNFISNYENDIKWRSGVIKMIQIPAGKAEVGTSTREVMRFYGRNMVTTAEVTEYIHNEKISFKVFSGMIPAWGYRKVEETPMGVNFTYSLSADLKGFYKIFSSVISKDYSKRIAEDLLRLKKVLG